MIVKNRFFHVSVKLLIVFVYLITESMRAQPNALVDIGDTSEKKATGHLKQELQLAGDYMVGRGVARDLKQSAYWYRKAADQGFPAAQVQLGYFYLAGLGVERDETQAAKWFERAAASGSREGKLNLAVLYLRGTGIAHDPHMGFVLIQQLADKQFPRAEDYLGVLYFLGFGVEKDPDKAERWFERAADHHSPEGEYAIGTLYSVTSGHPHNFVKATDYFRRSANSGYVSSMHSLGLLLVNHPEINHEPDEELHWLHTAAEGGAYRSSIVLGVLARDGKGGPKDEAVAYQWFTIAIKQGGQDAEKLVAADLKVARTTLTAEQQSKAELAAQTWLAAHPHEDIFLHGSEMNLAYFPMGEVYATGQDSQRVDKEASRN